MDDSQTLALHSRFVATLCDLRELVRVHTLEEPVDLDGAILAPSKDRVAPDVPDPLVESRVLASSIAQHGQYDAGTLASTMLTSSNDELLDLAQSMPELTLSGSGARTGVRLIKLLGAGGMSTVFLAELDPTQRSADLSPDTPTRLAIKMTQPTAMDALKTYNIDHRAIIRKDSMALSRVMEHTPPTEFVIGFYGGADSEVIVRGKKRELPWIAIEYVDGGAAGTSLQSRVSSTRDGVDPPRALRLVRGIIEGVRTLHAVGAIHRDLKPDNVLVAGPIDDETPKIADCGIARIAGVQSGTFNAFTVEYAGIEQLRTIPGEYNALIGTWTDVHALAAVIWFVVAGEEWCRGSNDSRHLVQGERRSLRTSQRVHPGFLADGALLDRIDAVLARGGAARLPPEAELLSGGTSTGAKLYAAVAATLPATTRFATVDAFAAELLPLLEAAAARWKERAAGENRPATAFRPTMMVQLLEGGVAQANIVEQAPRTIKGTLSRFGVDIEPLDARSFVFQPDGKVLARVGSRLIYFVEDQPHRVVVGDCEAAVARSRWLSRGAGGGFAVVGPSDLVLVRGGRVWAADLPKRNGAAVGEVQAVYGDGRTLGIVTAGTDESDDSPEFWQTTDGTSWSTPSELTIRGEIRAIAAGPFGFVAVGAASNGKSARAVHLGFNGQVSTMPWVKDLGPLDLVVCGAARESWAAGNGVLVRLERDAAIREPCSATDAPRALALDLAGQPWLVTERGVYRRHTDSGEPSWKQYYAREASRAPLVGIGFTPLGAHVFDASAGIVKIEPHDVATWRQKDVSRSADPSAG